jgi:thioredoxin-related protein
VVAVDVDKSRHDAERFLETFHPTFQLHFDPSGDLAARFQVRGMPTGILIDRRGVVRFTHIGFLPDDRVAHENELRQLLNER